LIRFGQIWLDLGEVWAKLKRNLEKRLDLSKFDWIRTKSKSCSSKNIRSPTAME